MKKNEKGFSVAHILMGIVVVAAVGFAGWHVFRSQQNNEQPSAAKSKVSTLSGIDTTNWETMSNTQYGYSYRIPKGEDWFHNSTLTDKASKVYSDGERINVEDTSYGGCGEDCGFGVFSFAVYVAGSKADVGKSYPENYLMKEGSFYAQSMGTASKYSLDSKSSVTKDGIEGTRWDYKPKDTKLAHIIFYYFNNKNYAYFFRINEFGNAPSDIDLTAYGEKMLSTLTFVK
jgi:hypothetical protein